METDNNKNLELADAALEWQSVLNELMESLVHQGATPAIERTTAEGENGSVYRYLAHLEQLIEEQRTEFDAFDFISRMFWGNEGARLWRNEEFQSNLLAWLLNPQGNHGAGDGFLKGFLRRTGAPAELVSADWDEATVVREWAHEVWGIEGRLGILILDETRGVLCAIENKISSTEHTDQLTRYRKALENWHGKLHRHHVFLSPNGVPPEQEEERKYWQAADYTTVFELVQPAGARRGGRRPRGCAPVPDAVCDHPEEKRYARHKRHRDGPKNLSGTPGAFRPHLAKQTQLRSGPETEAAGCH